MTATPSNPPIEPTSGVSITTGIHHITALAKDPAENLRFYTQTLGLRLVKKTVNFDDPGSYHLYFGDRLGRPGTLMTFFPHPMATRGTPGRGEVSRTVLAVPAGTLAWWRERLSTADLPAVRIAEAHGRLEFEDPHGTRLGLAERDAPSGEAPDGGAWATPFTDPWLSGPVPPERAVIAVDRAVLLVSDIAPSAAFLTEGLGWRRVPEDDAPTGERAIFEVGTGGVGQTLELHADPAAPRARLGAGSVHHVALRVGNDAAHAAAGEAVRRIGVLPTEVKDRSYFKSIYMREPGGVIVEIATDGPGFATDEDAGALGGALRLPPQFEGARAQIEARLPPLSDLAGASS